MVQFIFFCLKIMSLFKDALTKTLPPVLWHGSAYATEVLKPGFLWSKKLVEWDHGESNHYLYATTDQQTAISLGFASALEKRWRLNRYKTFGSKDVSILIESPDAITHYDLEQLLVWLYEIYPQNDQQWVFNHNLDNGLETEFKTHRTVPWQRRESVNLKHWLGSKDVNIKRTRQ